MRKTTTPPEQHPAPRSLPADAHVLDNKETQGFREGLRAYMPAWRAAKIQRAFLEFKREQFQRKGGLVKHPVLVRDVIK